MTLFELPSRVEVTTTMATIESLGDLIIAVRAIRRLTQEGAAAEIGISVETLHAFEANVGKQGPSLASVRRVLAWLADAERTAA